MRSHPALLTMRILWFALLAACFLYVVIAYVFLKTPPALQPNPMMPPVFGFVSLTIAVTSFLLPRWLYQQAARAVDVKTEEEVAPSAFPERYRDAMPKRVMFSDPKAAMGKAFACFMTPFILSLALSEAIALFGFVLAQIGNPRPFTAPFFVAGAILIAIRFPTQSAILGMFERARGASFPSQQS